MAKDGINSHMCSSRLAGPTTLMLSRSTSMTIYLYKKTHNKTGLKYLGKTTQDPIKYKGSGDLWKPHIRKHGYDVTTEILKECQTNEELKHWGLYYSELWNIVEEQDAAGKKTWANLIPESGEGIEHTEETIKKAVATRKENGSYDRTPEHTANLLESRRKNGTVNNQTPERVAKQLETRKRNGTLNPNTPKSNKKRWDTRRQNGTDKRTDDSIQKQKDTRIARNIPNPNTIQVTCIHCGKTIGKPNFGKYHGDRCKRKPN